MWIQTRSQPVYDVVIVGSGAAGGTAAKVLVEAGCNVALLEAGPLRRNYVDFAYHEPFPFEDPHRGLKSKPKSEEFKKIYASWQKFLAESNLWFRLAENNLDNYRYIMAAQQR